MRFFGKQGTGVNPVKELEAFLKEYNCKYDIVQSEQDKSVTRYKFDYQGGHFVCSLYDDKGVELCYPHCFDVPMSQLDMMRAECNKFNNIGLRFKCTYTIDEEENTVCLHVYSYCTMVARDMKDLLDMCFGVSRNFESDYNKAQENNEGNEWGDAEAVEADKCREDFLLRQLELEEQREDLPKRLNMEERLTVKRLLADVLGEADAECDALCVMLTGSGQEAIRLDDNEAIAEFDLSNMMIDGDDIDDCVALLKYHDRRHTDRSRTVTVTLTPDCADETSIYFRVTVMGVKRELNTGRTRTVADDGLSFLVAYDLASPKQKLQEFDYMWKEAQINLKEKGYDSLSEEQKLLADVLQENRGYNIYWGYKHMLASDYYTALLHLECAFRDMQTEYLRLTDRQKNMFEQLAYFVGMCLLELHEYDRACYYLGPIYDSGKINFARAYVIALVKMNDVRVFGVMDHLKSQVDDYYAPDDELPDRIEDFLAFLKRQNVTALVNFKEYDKAEACLKDMIESDASDDFAIKTLAELMKLRGDDAAAESGDKQAKG